jgi:hypothetical protein
MQWGGSERESNYGRESILRQAQDEERSWLGADKGRRRVGQENMKGMKNRKN